MPIPPHLVNQTEILLRAGSQWRLSPYLVSALAATGELEQAFQVPVFQSAILELMARNKLPQPLHIWDLSSPVGIAAVAVLDALLARETAAALYSNSPNDDAIRVNLGIDAPVVWAYRDAVDTRARTLCTPSFFGRILSAAYEFAPQNTSDMNLVLVTLSQADARLDANTVDRLPEGCFLIVAEWQQAGQKPQLFAWRRGWLQKHPDWIAFGPCGQEYGNVMPEACDSCVHGIRATLRRPGSLAPQDIPVWSYTIVAKSHASAELTSIDAISKDTLKQAFIDRARLRYIGTYQSATPTVDDPDSAHDNPTNTTWHEYIKVCPGFSGAPRLALERQAGMQVPPLRYGQWLELEHLQIQALAPTLPNVLVIRVRNEAAFRLEESGPAQNAFVPGYSAEVRAAVNEVGNRLFGFERMWDFQHATFARTLSGKSVLAIAATGGGKSECYILPAMLLPGITVVISPLKSLILDQFEQRIRTRYGLDSRTTFINSDVSFYERQGRLRRMVLGHFKLVYLTPEQLERGYVLDALRQADQKIGVRYIAFDEAHCISQWGHDFRPSYLNIVRRLAEYGLHPVCIALTATASPLVREDVCNELHLDRRSIGAGGDVLVESSNRSELNLVVRRTRNTEEKAGIITDQLLKLGGGGSAILFMPHTGGSPDRPQYMGAPISALSLENVGMTSPGVTAFAHYLETRLGQPVAMYHGALEDEAQPGENESKITRQAEQRAFMSGEKRIMVATKGFGMGIDKPDIRLVIHRSPPANLEAYAQEAGRAGRDQQLATVMLLFSEDRPQIVKVGANLHVHKMVVSSDREIQQYFIDNSYVRHQDLRAVYAFLRGGRPDRVAERLYFTSDQVAQFLDECMRRPEQGGLSQPYQWPDFAPRKSSATYESADHRVILDAGHRYESRRNLINRILAVMFSTRPSFEGTPAPLFQSLQEVGTDLIRFRLYKPDQILASTTYFGDRFRAVGVTAAELDELVPSGDRGDLTPLAQRLGLPLAETVSMLRDIRQAEGRTNKRGHWVGTLLDFWRTEVPRRVSLPDPYDPVVWRGYAGARRRAKPYAGKTLDDYFPPSVLSQPYGWEVAPDVGLEAVDPGIYLAELLTLHDSRRRNDENNFGYLLDHYIGTDDKPPKCLRSILLGYLKTGEVVIGGKCYGCSVCVPDLAFDNNPVEKRRAVIVQLFAETVELFDKLEAMNHERPAQEVLERVLQAVEAEEQAGRSGRTYMASWLARLIQDDPNHLAAHWTRFHAYRNDRLNLSPSEMLADLEAIIHVATEREDLWELRKAVEYCRSDIQFSVTATELALYLAELSGRLEDWQSESDAWQGLVVRLDESEAGSEKLEWLRKGLTRLVALQRPGGPLSQVALARETTQDAAMRLARLPGCTYESAHDSYGLIVSGWKWNQVKGELSHGKVPAHAGLVAAWLKANPESSEMRAAASDLAVITGEWDSWPPAAVRVVEAHLGPDLAQLPSLLLETAELLVLLYNDTELTVRFVLRAWAAKNELPPHLVEHLATHIGEIDATWCLEVTSADDKRAADLLDQLIGCNKMSDPNALCDRFPPSTLELLPPERLTMLIGQSLAANRPIAGALLDAMTRRLQHPDGDQFASALQVAVEQQPLRALSLLDALSTAHVVPVALADGLFPIVFGSPATRDRLPSLLDGLTAHREQHANDSPIRVCLEAWTMLRAERQALNALRATRIEGKELVRLVERWSSGSKPADLMDLLIIILEDIRSRSSSTWLTPVSLWFQVLCAAGRFEEAESALEQGSVRDISIKGQSAQGYLLSTRKRVRQRKPKFTSELHSLWRLAK